MRYLVVAILLLLSINVFSQTPWFVPKHLMKKKRFFYEINAGGAVPGIRYNSPLLNSYKQDYQIKPHGGVAFRVILKNYLGFSGNLSYMPYGTFIPHYNYSMNYSAINLHLPLEYNIKIKTLYKTKSDSYIFGTLGPYLAVPVQGKASINENEVKLSKSNIFPVDFGGEISVGYRVATFSLTGRSYLRFKISYYHGLVNTYSKSERNGSATAINEPFYSISGKRFNHGVRFTVGIEIPTKQKGTITFTGGGEDGKTYKRFIVID